MDTLIQRLLGPIRSPIAFPAFVPTHRCTRYYCWRKALARCFLLLPFLVLGPGRGRISSRCMSALLPHPLRLHYTLLRMHYTRWICVLTPSPSMRSRTPRRALLESWWPKASACGILVAANPSFPTGFYASRNPRWRRCPRCVNDYAATMSRRGSE